MAEELKDNPGVRVAYDNDGDRWDEQTDEAGVRTGWFRHCHPDPACLDGDELQLWQLVRMYGVARVVPASEDADRALLLWLHAEAAWKAGQFQTALRQERAISEYLDERRARWAEEHEKRRDELERSEASRRAWAEEAMRLDTIIHTQIGRFEAQALKADAKIGELPDALTAEACWRNAAKWLKKAVAVEDSGPQCSVHPDGGAE